MTEEVQNKTEGKLPFVLTFSYTEKLVGQMLVYATSQETIEDEVTNEFRGFIPDFEVQDTQQITSEEAEKLKAALADMEQPAKLN